MENGTLPSVSTVYGWTEIKEDASLRKYLLLKFPEYHSSLSKELVGIEVEVEKVPEWKDTPIWHPKEDGSLRDNGVEYISKPIPLDIVRPALLELYGEVLPPSCAFSKRTSIHVHVNVQDLNFLELKYLVYLYTIFENSLYRLVEEERRGSIFCIPLQETQLISELFINKDIQRKKVYWQKYCGINLLPVFTMGTLEFRHLHGTKNIDFICDWVTLLVYMKEFIKQTSVVEMNGIITNLNTNSNYYSLANQVFKDKANLIFSNREFNKEMERGVSYLKTEIFENRFRNTLQSSISKDSPLYKNLMHDTQDLEKAVWLAEGLDMATEEAFPTNIESIDPVLNLNMLSIQSGQTGPIPPPPEEAWHFANFTVTEGIL